MARIKLKAWLLGMAVAMASMPIYAHVKWFVEVDVSEAPRRLGEVLGPIFWLLLIAASIALFVAYVIDIRWSSTARFDWIERVFRGYRDIATDLVRIGTGVFFVMCWLVGDVILTPDLLTDSWFVGAIQLATAFFVLFESTLIVSGIGVLILYLYGVAEYGTYHMIDYVLFLGLAAYLVLTNIGGERVKRYRLPILIFAVLFSFLWSAVEKFGYPQWFDPFLDQYEFLTLGLPRDIFLMCAAFVEFTLIYVLLTGRNLVVVGAVALNVLIIAGAVYFGRIDTIGHFLVIVVLVILAITGVSRPRFVPAFNGQPVMIQAGALVAGYWAAFAIMFGLYYGIHALLFCH